MNKAWRGHYLLIFVVLMMNTSCKKNSSGGSNSLSEDMHPQYYILKDIADSEEYTQSYRGDQFPIALSKEIESQYRMEIGGEEGKEQKKYGLFVLFSTVGCAVCLDSEMANVESFYKDSIANNLNVKVIGFAHSDNIQSLARFKRASKLTFPLIPDPDDGLATEMKVKSTPISFLVDLESGIILAGAHPIKRKLDWSFYFFDFARKLTA